MAAAEFIEPGKRLGEMAVWQDVSPKAFEGDEGVVAIRCEPRSNEILQYFYAITAKGEKSLRALALTEAVICVNASSFHAWGYRWQCLEALFRPEELEVEKHFLQRIAASNMKNYQLWNHRRRLAFKLGPSNAQEEMEFSERCLEADAKNYHAWAHRQAVVSRFGLWEEELLYTQQILADDMRNNSAWNQRYFLLQQAGMPREQMLKRELEFVARAIAKAPHNESAWNFLRGLSMLAEGANAFLARNKLLHGICQGVLQEWPSCSPALSLLADIYTAQMRAPEVTGDSTACSMISRLAGECLERLETTDPIRRGYWFFRRQQLRESSRLHSSPDAMPPV